MAYFAEAEDLIPDAIPGIGFLDGDTLVPAPSGLTVRAVAGDAEWARWSRKGSRELGIFDEPGQPAAKDWPAPPQFPA